MFNFDKSSPEGATSNPPNYNNENINEPSLEQKHGSPSQDPEKQVDNKRLSSDDIYYNDNTSSSVTGGDLFHMHDEVLSKKMTLVNHAMNKIGFTPYHWKLFCLNGMGYGTDSLLFLLQSVTQNQIAAEFLYADQYNALVSSNCKFTRFIYL